MEIYCHGNNKSRARIESREHRVPYPEDITQLHAFLCRLDI